MDTTHLAVDGYVDGIPKPGTTKGTASFGLAISPDTHGPDTVFSCIAYDPRIVTVMLTEIQPGDVIRVSGIVVQPEEPGQPAQFTVDSLDVLDAAPGSILHMTLERFGPYVVVFDADSDTVPVFTDSGTWVGEAAGPDAIATLIDAFEGRGPAADAT